MIKCRYCKRGLRRVEGGWRDDTLVDGDDTWQVICTHAPENEHLHKPTEESIVQLILLKYEK